MIISSRVTRDNFIVLSPTSIVSGSKNYYVLQCSFSEDWEGLAKYAIISLNNDVWYSSEMIKAATGNTASVTLPEGLLGSAGVLRLGILGKQGDELRITTNIGNITIQQGVSEDGVLPPAPSPESDWDIYIDDKVKEITDQLLADFLESADTQTSASIAAAFATRTGGFIWYIDSDTIRDISGKSYGSMQTVIDAKQAYIGVWFYIRTTNSEAGSSAYPAKYKVSGADGFLSLGDYVVWTGRNLVHVSVYEAKASTQKNSDGQYSPRSGVDGLMSSTDKAYLADLIRMYWNPSIDSSSYNANNCMENGLYAPITLGRPPGVDSNERLGLWVIKDKTNGGVVQTAISFNVVGRMWMRSSATNRAEDFSDWKAIVSGDTVVPLFYRDNNGGNLPNWLIKNGVYHGISATAGGSPAEFIGSTNKTNWTIVVTVDPDDSTHVTQRAYNNENPSENLIRTGRGTGGGGMWQPWSLISVLTDESITHAMLAPELRTTDLSASFIQQSDGTVVAKVPYDDTSYGMVRLFISADPIEGDWIIDIRGISDRCTQIESIILLNSGTTISRNLYIQSTDRIQFMGMYTLSPGIPVNIGPVIPYVALQSPLEYGRALPGLMEKPLRYVTVSTDTAIDYVPGTLYKAPCDVKFPKMSNGTAFVVHVASESAAGSSVNFYDYQGNLFGGSPPGTSGVFYVAYAEGTYTLYH